MQTFAGKGQLATTGAVEALGAAAGTDGPQAALVPITPGGRIANFQAGAGGDVLDLQSWLAAGNLPGYVPGTNPFETGQLAWAQYLSPAPGPPYIALVALPSGMTVVILENLQTGDLCAENLGGFRVPAVMDYQGRITGNGDAEVLTGDAGDNPIIGFGGSDTLNGGDGNDNLIGDDWRPGHRLGAADTLNGGAGDDSLIGGAGNDTLNGGDGADVLYTGVVQFDSPYEPTTSVAFTTLIHEADGGLDTVDGGAGDDVAWLMYAHTTQGVVADISNPAVTRTITIGGSAAGSVTSVERAHMFGGSGADTFTGADQISESLAGYSVAGVLRNQHGDVLSGGAGNDILRGLGGNDVLDGGDGVDRLEGGDGFDVASFVASTAGVNVDLALATQADGDVLISIEALSGSNHSDILRGSSANEILGDLYAGDDVIEGRGGDDIIGVQRYSSSTNHVRVDGGDGNDTISVTGATSAEILGGSGEDVVFFEIDRGQATISLGAGMDILKFDGSKVGGLGHVVTDFATGIGGDILDLSEWFQTSGLSPFRTGELRLVQSGQDTLLQLDTYGPAVEFVTVITFRNTQAASFTAGNFGGLTPDATVNYIEGTYLSDTLTGTSADDEIRGADGSDALRGGDGNDVIRAGNPPYYNMGTRGSGLDGGLGDDVLSGGGVNDLLIGGDGRDVLFAGSGADTLIGGISAFTSTPQTVSPFGQPLTVLSHSLLQAVVDDGLADQLFAGGGDDIVYLGVGDRADGGDGTDLLVVDLGALTAGVSLNLTDGGAGLAAAAGGSAISFEGFVVKATDHADTFTAGNGADDINGAGGNDTLVGGIGANRLAGGLGADTLRGEAGNDTLSNGQYHGGSLIRVGEGYVISYALDDGAADSLEGGDGNDIIFAGYGDSADGGVGTDSLHLSLIARTSGVNLDLTSDAQARLQAVQGGSLAGFETFSNLYLTGFDDVLRVGASGNFYGAAGDDTIYGNDAIQYLMGEAGDDRLEAFGGDDRLWGGAGDDVLLGGDGVDVLEGDADNDGGLNATTDGGADLLDGGAGNDNIWGGGGSDTIIGGTGNDVIRSDENSRRPGIAVGDPGDDIVDGGEGNDNIQAGAGNDTLTGGLGTDTLNGGSGVDTAVFSGNRAAYTLEIISTDTVRVTGPDGTDTLTGIERLKFSDGLFGMDGLPLPTEMSGTPNADVLNGTAGRDAIDAGAGDDVITGGASNDTIDGGAGTDTAVFSEGAYTVAIDAGVVTVTGPDGVDTLANVERLRFGAANVMVEALRGANTLGTTAGETLTGGATADGLFGLGGDDALNGGDGDDVLAGGAGVDVLTGGNGFDTADYSAAAAAVTARLDTLRSTTDGDGGTDTFVSIEAITGSAFNDLLVGGTLGDTLRGGLGADTLLGQGGNDILWGGQGAVNQLQGGVGDDTYVLEVLDSVVEAAGAGTDTVDARINAYNLAANVENLIFGGTGNFSGTGNALNNIMTGGAGDDLLRGRGGVDSLIGGAGMDTADYSQAAAGVNARLDVMRAVNDGDGATDTYTSIEAILGSAFNDTLIGGTLGDRLSGGLGADTLLGFAGNDILAGGQGLANQLQGGLGDDLYVLDAYDTIVELAGQGHDTIEAHVGAHVMAANVEDMFYVGFNKFYGTGNAGNNTITGGNGDDILKGMGGSDRLFGGAGYDEVHVRGTKAQYTVTAEGAGWRIVDTVAGRDGSIYVESIEGLRFLNGNTKTVLTYGALASDEAEGKGAAPETMPALLDDAFVLPPLKDLGPEVMPDVSGGLLASREFGGFEALLARFEANALVIDGPHGLHLLMDDGYGHRDGDWLA